MKALEVTYEILPEDYIQYILYRNWDSPDRLKFKLFLHLIVGIAYFGLLYGRFETPLFTPWNIALFSVGIGLQLLLPYLMKRRIASLASKYFAKNYPKGHQKTRLRLTNEGIELENNDATSFTSLQQIGKPEEIEDLLVIPLSESVLIIHQKNFQDRKHYDNFVDELLAFLSKKNL